MNINKIHTTNFGAFGHECAKKLLEKSPQELLPANKALVVKAAENDNIHVTQQKDGKWILGCTYKNEKTKDGHLKIIPIYALPAFETPVDAVVQAEKLDKDIKRNEIMKSYSMSSEQILKYYTV